MNDTPAITRQPWFTGNRSSYRIPAWYKKRDLKFEILFLV